MVERGYTNLGKLKNISSKDDLPIKSQFKLSFNTVLNLIHNHEPKMREKILKMNFDFFQRKQQSNKQIRIMASFNHKVKVLKSLGYIQGDSLTDKGRFATHIYSNELLISEIFSTNLYKQLSEKEINILTAAVIYEPRRKDYFTLKGSARTVNHIMQTISNKKYVIKNLNKLHLKRMTRVIGDFTEGADFKDLLELCSLDEGDLIRLIRRVIDMLRQVAHASEDYDMQDKIHSCINKIYRSVVRFEF
jgi:superfamily II RNA helicase